MVWNRKAAFGRIIIPKSIYMMCAGYPIGQPVITDKLLDVFDGVQFGRPWRQGHAEELAGVFGLAVFRHRGSLARSLECPMISKISFMILRCLQCEF